MELTDLWVGPITFSHHWDTLHRSLLCWCDTVLVSVSGALVVTFLSNQLVVRKEAFLLHASLAAAMAEEKEDHSSYLAELVAEKESLSPSYSHALRLLQQGRSSSDMAVPLASYARIAERLCSWRYGDVVDGPIGWKATVSHINYELQCGSV